MSITVDDPIAVADEAYQDACHLVDRTERECAEVRAHIDELKRSYAVSERSRLLGNGHQARCTALRKELGEERDRLVALEHVLATFTLQREKARAERERAKQEAARQEAIDAWNRLAGEHETALRRLEKGLREVAAAIELHRKLSYESFQVAEAAGMHPPRWDVWAERTLQHTLRHRLAGLGIVDVPNMRLLEQMGISAGKHLWDCCPYVQRVEGIIENTKVE